MIKTTIRTLCVLTMISCVSLFSMAQGEQNSIKADNNHQNSTTDSIVDYQNHIDLRSISNNSDFGEITQRNCGCNVSNLLPDGDFESLLPVTSGLGINCTCAGSSVCVGHEPRDKCGNSLWIDDLWDHTLGTSAGNFLIVDGGNGSVWSETVPVVAGQAYVFSFWEIREVSDNLFGNNSTQTFDLKVNGTVIASFNTASALEDEWTQYCTTWTSTFNSASTTIEIVQTSGSGYNDYGIDDIEFGQCIIPCEIPELLDYITIGNSSKDCYKYKFKSVLSATNLCYRWYIDGMLVSTADGFVYVFSSDGAYEICVEISCCDDPNVEPVFYCETLLIDCKEDGCGCTINDQLPNGDFENTSIPVTSGLPVNCTCASGSVCVGHEPRDKCMNSYWIDDLWDHTLGTPDGHFLIVDGTNGTIWAETVTLDAGSMYIFEFWEIREVSDNNFGNNSTQTFDLVIDGNIIASFNTATALEDKWTLYCANWEAPYSSSGSTIEIRQTSGTGYNDYGIDDIQFGKCAGTKMNVSNVIDATDEDIAIKLYPNPAVNSITVEWNESAEINEISIYNTDGKLVKQLKVDARNNMTIDLSDLTEGIYLLRTNANNVERFVIKK
ncbi:MAG: T9SS type A sorting domain-containing protein [Crocinitomicaceae bacterium]|nr:T9SS type A sorting domain-containing protein [Flavobacteriales bacterium]NQZ35273.1 T9SS type A sorting domain-containing protein [Crocinitomicaceae bacterium]